MSNKLNALETVVADFGVRIEQQMPIINSMTRDMENKFTDQSGETVYVAMPDYGSGLTAGADASSTSGDVHKEKIPITISCKHDAVNMNILEQAFEAGNAKDTIMTPRIQHVGSDIEKEAISSILLNAGSAEIYGSGTADYKHIRKIGAHIRMSRLPSEIFCAIPPLMGAEVKDSGLAYFQASTLDSTFGSRAYGRIDGTEMIETPDITALTTGTHALGSGTTMKIKTTSDTNGDYQLTFKVVGGTATLAGTVAAGEILYLKDAATGKYVNGCDVYKVSKGQKFPFIVQETATASGNEITLKVQKLYYTATDPRKNIDVTSIPADMIAEFGMVASTTYNRAGLWTKSAMMFANRPLPEIKGCENMQATTLKGLKFLQSTGGNINTAANKTVWRVMTGVAPVYNSGISVYYVKQS